MKRIALILSICLLLISGCGMDQVDIDTENPISPPVLDENPPAVENDSVMDLLQTLTTEEKVGQLFIVRPESLGGTTELNDAMQQMLTQYPVGGIAMFSQNISTPQQIAAFTRQLQDFAKVPLFIAVDEEGGSVARLANGKNFDLPRYKNAAAVGSGNDPADAMNMGITIGSYLSEFGFNLNFAPVADVNTNPNNPVIGSRAFSSDPAMASNMAHAMADGLNSKGIAAVFKHFPGHGDTEQDSHYGLASSSKTLEQLRACELIPYFDLHATDCVMVGHIALPNVTGSDVPATFSKEIVTDILKEDLQFEGLVITDSLEMGAVTALYSSGEASVLALEAGCDILLMPLNFQESFQAVLSALDSGRLTEQWLDETAYRILFFKHAYGLI